MCQNQTPVEMCQILLGLQRLVKKTYAFLLVRIFVREACKWLGTSYDPESNESYMMIVPAAERDRLNNSNPTRGMYTKENLFEILLNQTEINRKIVNTIWFRFDLIRFLCVYMKEKHSYAAT